MRLSLLVKGRLLGMILMYKIGINKNKQATKKIKAKNEEIFKQNKTKQNKTTIKEIYQERDQ